MAERRVAYCLCGIHGMLLFVSLAILYAHGWSPAALCWLGFLWHAGLSIWCVVFDMVKECRHG